MIAKISANYDIQHNLLSIGIDGRMKPITWQATSNRDGVEVMKRNNIRGNVFENIYNVAL
jgi:hypothetical protein